MILKRDITSTSAPAPEQIEVGELVFNANTGILFAKMQNGTVIKYLGSPVCQTPDDQTCPVPVPDIKTSDITNFCCGGDSLIVYINNLLVNHRYLCQITDLISNSTMVISQNQVELLPLTSSSRSMALNLTIDKNVQAVALIKISVLEIVSAGGTTQNLIRSEKILDICCTQCNG